MKYNYIIILFFLVFHDIQAHPIFHDVREKQRLSPEVILVGSLDMGLQTGIISNTIHTLSTGIIYQLQTQKILADFNGDGAVNFSDFIIFAIGFGRRQPDVEYNVVLDLNGDGEIGFSDFLLFAAAFTG